MLPSAHMQLVALLLKPFIPRATRWVHEQEALIVTQGRTLSESEVEDARQVGVAHPERIHIMVVDSIQPPNHPLLVFASKFVNLIGPHTAGLTLNYGIYIRHDCSDYSLNRELYIHEFCHVGQYERLGSVDAFLSEYLPECVVPGYPMGPLEQEAIQEAAKVVGHTTGDCS